jgi:hypothetical protein
MSAPQQLALHTPMPIMPLTQMVAEMGQVMPDVNGRGIKCCFYGWGEVMEADCKPHNLVYCDDNVTVKWMATTLKAMGVQVVVTDRADWSEVIGIMPILYDDAHSH